MVAFYIGLYSTIYVKDTYCLKIGISICLKAASCIFLGDNVNGTGQRVTSVNHTHWPLHYFYMIHILKVQLSQVNTSILSAYYRNPINQYFNVLARQSLHTDARTQYPIIFNLNIQFVRQ